MPGKKPKSQQRTNARWNQYAKSNEVKPASLGMALGKSRDGKYVGIYQGVRTGGETDCCSVSDKQPEMTVVIAGNSEHTKNQ